MLINYNIIQIFFSLFSHLRQEKVKLCIIWCTIQCQVSWQRSYYLVRNGFVHVRAFVSTRYRDPNPQSLNSRTISIAVAIFMMMVNTTTNYIAVLEGDNVPFLHNLPVTGVLNSKITYPTEKFKLGVLRHVLRIKACGIS